MTTPLRRLSLPCFAVFAALALASCASEKPVLHAHASSPQNAAGVALLQKGQEDAARAAFERALDDALRSSDEHAEIDARLNLALMAIDREDHARAAHHLALAIERMVSWGQLGTEDRAVSWVTGAELAFAMGHREMQEFVYDGAKRLGADAGLLLALAACARGDLVDPTGELAAKRFEAAERDVLHIRVLRCEARAALRRRDIDTALAFADRAIEVDKRGHDARALRDDLALGARALEKSDNPAKALYRWLEVARVDAAMASPEGLREASAAVAALVPRVAESDKRRAAIVLDDLRERLALHEGSQRAIAK
jgi:tetratricopeptide (TPR) repeat protein